MADTAAESNGSSSSADSEEESSQSESRAKIIEVSVPSGSTPEP